MLRKPPNAASRALSTAIGHLIDQFTPQECANFFRHRI
jgi:hypothetical protein